MENEIIKRFDELYLEGADEDTEWHFNQAGMNGIKEFFLSELKALKEECVGKERKTSWIKEEEAFLNIDNAYATGLIEGDKNKRQEIIKAFEKKGV